MRNLVAEKAIIGALLASRQDYWRVADVLRAEHFDVPLHRRIFEVIADIHNSGQQFSLPLVLGRLPEESNGQMMSAILAVLIKGTEDIGSALDFVDDLVDSWARGRAIALADRLKNGAADRGAPIGETLAEAEVQLADLAHGAEARAEKSIKAVLSVVVDRSAEAHRDEFVPGFDTGLPSLDELVGRIMPGDLGVIGAGVKEGKTAIATQIQMRASMTKPSLQIQQEMPAEEVVRRILAGEAGISSTEIEEGSFDFDGFERLRAAQKRLEERNFYIYAQGQMRLRQIRDRCAAMKRSRGLGLVVVDSLKRTRADGKTRDVFERIDEVTTGLKAMALELDIAVILLAHRTRGSQDRDDPLPRPTDFYGGGSIEENADWVLGLWRRDIWLKTRRPPQSDQKKFDAWVKDLDNSRGKLGIACLLSRRRDFPNEREFRWNGRATRAEELT